VTTAANLANRRTWRRDDCGDLASLVNVTSAANLAA
jgi:hypothetical protein